MDIDITIKNYRCFPRRTPARIQVRPGFTAFVGLNNSGKSSLLRFFYEFRELFRFIAPGSPAFVHALAGRGHSLTFPRHIADVDEIFSDSAKGDLEIEIRAQPLNRRGPTPPEWLRLTVLRGTNTVTAELDPMSHVFDRQSLAFAAGNNQVLQGGPSQGVRFDVSGFFDAAKILAQGTSTLVSSFLAATCRLSTGFYENDEPLKKRHYRWGASFWHLPPFLLWRLPGTNAVSKRDESSRCH